MGQSPEGGWAGGSGSWEQNAFFAGARNDGWEKGGGLGSLSNGTCQMV